MEPRIDTVNLLNKKKRKINVLAIGILNQMMLHNNIVSESEFWIQKWSLFHQDDHLISRILNSRDKSLD